MTCFLAPFSDKPCDGQLVRAHLIPKQRLKDCWRQAHHRKLPVPEIVAALAPWPKLDDLIWDERVWVPACGGPMGNSGHHGMLDQSRTLRVPRHAIPVGTEEAARALGLGWYLDRVYGPVNESRERAG